MRELKKIPFLHLPTPLEHLPRLSEKLGIQLWMKRDDLTGLGMGGNKLRKLEYLLYDAKQQGATRLLTVGGAQTNHGRLTAAVAAKYGLKCTIACIDDYPGEVSANLLLDRIMGAQVVIKKDGGRPEAEQYDELLQKLSQRYEAEGEKVYCIPMGGSNLVGMCGYRECAQEIDAQAKQLGLGNARLVCAVGSIGTYMGLYCGFASIMRKFAASWNWSRESSRIFRLKRAIPGADTTTLASRCGKRFTRWPARRPSCWIRAIRERPLQECRR